MESKTFIVSNKKHIAPEWAWWYQKQSILKWSPNIQQLRNMGRAVFTHGLKEIHFKEIVNREIKHLKFVFPSITIPVNPVSNLIMH
jgi:hypothetical protein